MILCLVLYLLLHRYFPKPLVHVTATATKRALTITTAAPTAMSPPVPLYLLFLRLLLLGPRALVTRHILCISLVLFNQSFDRWWRWCWQEQRRRRQWRKDNLGTIATSRPMLCHLLILPLLLSIHRVWQCDTKWIILLQTLGLGAMSYVVCIPRVIVVMFHVASERIESSHWDLRCCMPCSAHRADNTTSNGIAWHSIA